MKLLVRLLFCTMVIANILFGMPSFADSPAANSGIGDAPATESSTSTTTTNATSTPKESAGADSEVSMPPDVKQFFDRMGVKQPQDKADALGMLGAILGLSSSIMLITGSILPACLKRFDLLKGMLGIGVICGMISLACPALVDASGGARIEVGTALVISFLVLYIAVFFLPAILAFKDNTQKKWLITVINAAGLAIPAVGLVALFIALKDKPVAKPHSVIG